MPQYVLGHPERLERDRGRARASIRGSALAGAAYRGVGIPDCIRSGELAAESVVRAARRSARVSRERSERLFAEALDLLPGGVSSPVRAFRAVGGSPLFIERGEGAYLVDVDGNRYVDYVLSWGPLILGHAHPRVVAALEEALRKGTSFGAPSPLELELAAPDPRGAAEHRARALRELGHRGDDERAAASRARSRAATKIVKFVGCYHGHADFLLVQAGSGVATLGLPDSPGVTPGAVADTLDGAVQRPRRRRAALRGAHEIAAVILEPVVGNMGLVLPQPGFLEGLRELTTAHGALLVFDEVMTGLPRPPGRRAGAATASRPT